MLEMDKREDGFTLIEILVVILIIGILTAIAVPVFLNQRKKAVDAAVQSDIRNLVLATKTYFTNNPDTTTVDWTKIKSMASKSNGVRLTWTGQPHDWCVEGLSLNAGSYVSNWTYSSISGDTVKGNQSAFSCSNMGTTTHTNHLVWPVDG